MNRNDTLFHSGSFQPKRFQLSFVVAFANQSTSLAGSGRKVIFDGAQVGQANA